MTSKITLPHHSIVAKWKEEKVIKWLKKVQLDDCIPAFEIRHIDGPKLLELTEQKLFTYQDLKIKHRKQIAKCVQECKSQASNAKRIAKNLKHNHGASHSQSVDANEPYDSEEDFDDWGSDFEDSDEGVEEESFEVNNNTIVQSSPDLEIKSSGSSQTQETSQEKTIPKPPDISILPKAVNTSTVFRNTNQTNCIPRPPIKRPPSQPPPPPVSQIPNQEQLQEDYEIPIVSLATSVNSYPSSSSLQSGSSETVIETYEIVEAPEENYEIVDSPSTIRNMSERPILPPRFIKSPGSVSPPPLPQKPLRLKENLLSNEKSDGVKTFCRPKLPVKSESETQFEASPPTSNSIGFISSLIGRRSSITPTSSPTSQPKNKDTNDCFASSPPNAKFMNGSLSSLSSSSSSSTDKDAFIIVGSSSFLKLGSPQATDVKKSTPLPPLPPRGPLNISEETAQNMATRPLPPVPTSNIQEKLPDQIQDIQHYPWFHEIEREHAETAVKNLNEPGSFVVRPSKRAGKENPYSLTVLHDGKLFHLNVRQRPDNTFALGKEKEKEKTFPNVAELITYHQNEPILLKNRGEPAGKTRLCKYPEKA